jgi:acetyl-CoA synthetase
LQAIERNVKRHTNIGLPGRNAPMSEKIYPVPASWKKRALIDDAAYKKMYADSIKDPAKFWARHAKRIDWFKAPKKIKNTSYAYPDVSIKWYED